MATQAIRSVCAGDGPTGPMQASKDNLVRHARRLERLPAASEARSTTVNAAFLREIKEDNEELRYRLAELHTRCRGPLDPEDCRFVIDRLHALLDGLAMHFSLEEAYGYFDDPVEVAPRFSEMAARLREEHRTLYVGLIDLIEWAEYLFRDKLFPRHSLWLLQAYLGSRVLRFEERLWVHEREERVLMGDAYSTDLGVGD